MYRHIALYRRSWPRLLELAYWPVLQLCVWGFTASFIASRAGGNAMVAAGGVLLGGVPLWEVALRSQMASPSASSRKSGRAKSGMYLSARCGRGSGRGPARPSPCACSPPSRPLLLAGAARRLQPVLDRTGNRAAVRQPPGDGMVGPARRRLADPAARHGGGSARLVGAVRPDALSAVFYPVSASGPRRSSRSPSPCRRRMSSRACARPCCTTRSPGGISPGRSV